MSIELSGELAITIFKGAATLMGVCIAILAILAGLLSREKNLQRLWRIRAKAVDLSF